MTVGTPLTHLRVRVRLVCAYVALLILGQANKCVYEDVVEGLG